MSLKQFFFSNKINPESFISGIPDFISLLEQSVDYIL